MDTLSRVTTLSKLFLFPSKKGFTFKRKNQFPILSFKSRPTFQKGVCVQKSKQEGTKVVSAVK